jgi:hypothetical protein
VAGVTSNSEFVGFSWDLGRRFSALH